MPYSKDEIWFHGDINDRESFKNQNFDRDVTTENLNANGPGIYFTSNKNEAKGYGKYLYNCILDVKKQRLLTDNIKTTKQLIINLINFCNIKQRNEMLQNFDENIHKAMNEAIKIYSTIQPFIDTAVSIYHDIYQYCSNEWINGMIRIGFDAYKPQHLNHVIVYNYNIIKIIKKEYIN